MEHQLTALERKIDDLLASVDEKHDDAKDAKADAAEIETSGNLVPKT